MKKKYIYIVAIVFVFILGLNIITVNALTISPPLMEIDANPGEAVKQTIKIIADADTEGIFYPSVSNFAARGEEGEPGFLESEETKSYSMADWIEIDRSPIVLKKNKRAEISFVIRVPDNAEPGGHYGVIFFSTQNPTFEKSQTAIGVIGKLGSLILVKVAGELKEEGHLLDFDTTNNKTFYNRLPIEFTARFENTGNIHLKPQGEIKISNFFGKEIGKVSVNDKGGNVLPESIRKFKSVWGNKDGIFKKGSGFFEELKKEKNNFSFGRYKAELILVGFEGGTKSIWVFPWRLLLVYLIVIVLVVILFTQFIKSYNRRIVARYGNRK